MASTQLNIKKETVVALNGCCFFNSAMLYWSTKALCCVMRVLDASPAEGDCISVKAVSGMCYSCCPNHPRPMLVCCDGCFIMDPCSLCFGEYKVNLRWMHAELEDEIKSGVQPSICCRCHWRWAHGGAVCPANVNVEGRQGGGGAPKNEPEPQRDIVAAEIKDEVVGAVKDEVANAVKEAVLPVEKEAPEPEEEEEPEPEEEDEE